MKRLPALRALAVSVALMASGPGVAQACGGCFHPRPPMQTRQVVQVVTDHRMVLSLSAQRTTLWDQFSFAGRPGEFSWILPIRYTPGTVVALASDAFMSAADQLTAPILRSPPPPLQPFCGGNQGGRGDAGPPADSPGIADSGAPGPPPVTVLREEVVGPYAVNIIRGTDPMAIRTWLRDNGYAVPTAIEPVIDHYTGLNMDYIALRLRPGEGINRMSPVRVTLEGNLPRLPLRMVAAGVADKVGLSLIVFANARMEAMNFPNGELSDNDFTWDWSLRNNSTRDFLNAFERLNNAHAGRLWLTEMSGTQTQSTLRNMALTFAMSMAPLPDAGLSQADGGVLAAVDPGVDVDTAFAGLGPQATVTRLRADLLGRLLDRDLELGSSSDGPRARLYQYGIERNRPPDGTCDGGVAPPRGFDAGLPPRDPGPGPRDAGNPLLGLDARGVPDDLGPDDPTLAPPSSGGLSCAATPATPGVPRAGALSLVALGLVAARTRRRRQPD